MPAQCALFADVNDPVRLGDDPARPAVSALRNREIVRRLSVIVWVSG